MRFSNYFLDLCQDLYHPIFKTDDDDDDFQCAMTMTTTKIIIIMMIMMTMRMMIMMHECHFQCQDVYHPIFETDNDEDFQCVVAMTMMIMMTMRMMMMMHECHFQCVVAMTSKGAGCEGGQ